MKKAYLLLFVGMFLFGNSGFTREPEIVNPPRPTKKFKYLLEIKYNKISNWVAQTLFIYTDSFHTEYFQDTYHGYKLILDLPSQLCYNQRNKIDHDNYCFDVAPGFDLTLGLADAPNLVDVASFLVAKAPKPRKMTAEERRWATDKQMPQKAKVVFK